MFSNYLKIAFRNLLKNKVYSSINIFGLAINMAACFFIFQYIRFELSYDKFHKLESRIYRVPIKYGGSFTGGTRVINHPAVGPAMKADFPEVESFTPIVSSSVFAKTITLSYDNGRGEVKRFNEGKVFSADPSFLTMFSFPFVEGDASTALNEAGSIVILEATAKKYFGNINPLNKIVNFNQAGYQAGL